MNFRIYADFPTDFLGWNFKQLRSVFVDALCSFFKTFSTKNFQGSVGEELIEYGCSSQVPKQDSDTWENLVFLLGEEGFWKTIF